LMFCSMRPRPPIPGGRGRFCFVEEDHHERDERHEKESTAEDAKNAEMIKVVRNQFVNSDQ